MAKFQFKKSKYDFDYILEKNGFVISKDHEEVLFFSKNVEIDNDLLKSFNSVKAKIDISRMKILSDDFKYELFSPYVIHFRFQAFPLYTERVITWNTFPGEHPEVLETILKIVEAEAKICAYNFMQTDVQITEKLKNKSN